MAKASVAVMEGAYENQDPSVTKKRAEDILSGKAKDSDSWVQIGYNPYRHSFFYNKNDIIKNKENIESVKDNYKKKNPTATDEQATDYALKNSKIDNVLPVESAEQIIQIGKLVLAKNVKYAKQKPVADIDGRQVRFQLSDNHSVEETSKGVFQLKKLGKRIGEIVTSSYSIPNYKDVALSFINLDKRGKGLGKELYREVATILESRGEVLISSGFRNDASNNVWKSLVEDGYAEEIGKIKLMVSLYTLCFLMTHLVVLLQKLNSNVLFVSRR